MSDYKTPASKADFQTLINEGAQILDVRSPEEFDGGHLKNALNIPIDQLTANTHLLDGQRTIITVCHSGMRSASAAEWLRINGFRVYDAGPWVNLL